LVSDEPAQEAEEEDTGGAVGPLGLLFAALLAAVGLRQRRRFV
jgi:MYXO-CTERM domain-containing protein